MDKITAFLSGFIVLCLCVTVSIFVFEVGKEADKAVLSFISGACGLVGVGGGIIIGKTLKKGE